jgi:serine phosphatase RsbU (regulator of sigma subunit)
MTCRALFRAQPEPEASPARVLSNVNRMLSGNIKRGMFVSASYAVLDTAQHTLTVGNAGHLPTVIWRPKARIATVHPSKSPVLGILPPSAYEAQAQEESLTLGPGDRFIFLTDGVNEAMAPGQKEFGMEHLRRRLQTESEHPSDEFLRHLMEQIELHRSGGEQSDDITLVTGRRLA